MGKGYTGRGNWGPYLCFFRTGERRKGFVVVAFEDWVVVVRWPSGQKLHNQCVVAAEQLVAAAAVFVVVGVATKKKKKH